MKIYRNNIELYELVIDDRTKLSKKLMAEDKVLFDYCSPVKLDVQVDDYLLIDGIKYTLNRPAKEQKASLTEYRYTGEFEAPIYFLLDKLYLLNDSSEFYLVGTAEDFIDLLITNMNSIHPEWSKGIISNTDRKNLSFNSVNCGEALNQIASQFNLEYEITDKQISLKERIENETALSFEHGKGKGLYNLSREAVDDENTVTRAFIFGSSRNLEYTYRNGASNRLIFENADGTHYLENTSEYNRIVEKTVVFEDIWPRFTGVINSVSADKKTISCNSIDFNLNDQLLSGITAKVVFLSGDLMGFTFEIASYDHSTKVIRLNSVIKEAGLLLPDPATFFPSPGDQFTFIDIKMPQTYVDNAEALLKTEGQKWLDYYSQLRVKYSLTLDHRYLRDNNISLHVGDVISVADADLNINKQIRIVGFSKNLDGSGVTAEISNYREESISKQIRSKLNDTITQLTQTSSQIKQIESNNAGSRLTGGTISKTIPALQPAEAVTDTMKMEAHAVGKTESQYIEASQIAEYIKSKFGVTITPTQTIWDRDMHITGNITASQEVAAWVTGIIESNVFANLNAQDPIYKVNDSTFGLRTNAAQFEIVGGALQIKAGILAPASHNHAISDITGLQAALNTKLETSLKGTANGLAELDSNGKVLSSQLPSFVDDVLEFSTFNALPIIGESGKIYITIDDGQEYRWTGSVYGVISPTIALGETSTTAYRGDRGKIAYDYSQIGHLPLHATADNSLKFAGYQGNYNETIYGPNTGGVMAFDNSVGYFRQLQLGDLKLWLGLGSNAYTSGSYPNIYQYGGTYDANTLNNASFIRTNYQWANVPVGSIGVLINNAYSQDWIAQEYFDLTNDDVYIRRRYGGTTWGDWNKLWHSGNFNPSNYLPLSGGYLSGDLFISKNAPYLHLNRTNIDSEVGITFGTNGGYSWYNYMSNNQENIYWYYGGIKMGLTPTGDLSTTGIIKSTSTYGFTVGDLAGAQRLYYLPSTDYFEFVSSTNDYANLRVKNLNTTGDITVSQAHAYYYNFHAYSGGFDWQLGSDAYTGEGMYLYNQQVGYVFQLSKTGNGWFNGSVRSTSFILSGVGNPLYFDTTNSAQSNWIKTTDDYDLTLFCGRGTTSKLTLNSSGQAVFTGTGIFNGYLGIGITPAYKFQVEDNRTSDWAGVIKNMGDGYGLFVQANITDSKYVLGLFNGSTYVLKSYGNGDLWVTRNGLFEGNIHSNGDFLSGNNFRFITGDGSDYQNLYAKNIVAYGSITVGGHSIIRSTANAFQFRNDNDNDYAGTSSYYHAINVGGSSRGGLGTYTWVSGAGTDYGIGLFSEADMWFATGGSATKKLTLDTSGNLTASGEITAYSDRRLKSNIKPLTLRGDLKPVTYQKNGKESIGFIAQEVREYYPELVLGKESEEMLSLNYGQLTAVLYAEIIQLKERIKTLENGSITRN